MRTLWPAPLVLATLLMAGCAAPTAELVGDAAPALEVPRVAPTAHAIGQPLREPAIAQLPDGTLFVAGYSGGARRADTFSYLLLYRSSDAGASWTRVEQGTVAEGAMGNSDADLAVAPDGTLYHATMLWFPWGHSIAVGASPDGGVSWSWRTLALGPWVDRPWVEVGPDGVAHVTWSSARGLHHATSADRGASWREGPLVHATGGSGGLAIGPGGEIAVRYFPQRAPTHLLVTFGFLFVDPSADGVAVSRDGGATWEHRTLPGTRAYSDVLGRGGDIPRWSDPLAFDAAGTLYAAWGENGSIQLARSGDLGATWDVVELPRADDAPAYYPFLRAGAAGEVVASWFTGEQSTPRIALVIAADTATPIVSERVLDVDMRGDPAGEYFQVVLLREGGVAAALPLATDAPETSGFAFAALS